MKQALKTDIFEDSAALLAAVGIDAALTHGAN
jgi:hypothetical protein